MILITYFYFMKFIITDEKKLSWALTALVSSVYPFLSLPYLTYEYCEYLKTDYFSSLAILYFIEYLALDLILGCMYYYKELGLLTSWIHHILYIMYCTHMYFKGYTRAFMPCLLLEVPTSVLSIGRIFPHLRNDGLFGLTFFIFRILYNFFLIVRSTVDYEFTLVLCAMFCLHAYWFINWFLKYGYKIF